MQCAQKLFLLCTFRSGFGEICQIIGFCGHDRVLDQNTTDPPIRVCPENAVGATVLDEKEEKHKKRREDFPEKMRKGSTSRSPHVITT